MHHPYKLMQKPIFNLFFGYLLALVLIYPSSVSSNMNPITMTIAYSEVDSFPFQVGKGTKIGTPPGFTIEIIKQAAKDIGIKVVFVRYPNKRVLISLSRGEVDGAGIYSFKKERLISGLYPMKNGKLNDANRIGTIGYYFYKLKSSPLKFDGKTLSGHEQKIGANRGYSIVDDLKNMGIPVSEVSSTIQNFKMLQLKRISGVANQNIDADPLIEAYGYTNIEKLLPAIKSKPYFLMLGHRFVEKYPLVSKKLWNRIGEIREQKTKEILHKYKYKLD
ncbi:MAG: transporter substrate-binding domain-containing protein [Campylobacteraceae bacterium]|nr:transporter substrate-binding domain-containing protein [Campylobacteraceae bacterium]